MKKSHLLGAACACLSVMPFNASAALIDNGNTTIDTATGLEWLDLTLTQGQSYNNIVIDGFGGYAVQGYVHATTEQLCGLFGSLGDDMTGCTDATNNVLNIIEQSTATTLTNYLGVTFSDPTNSGAYGLFDDGSDTDIGLGCVEVGSTGTCKSDTGPLVYRLLGWATKADYHSTAGNWLVRPSQVPVPAAVWLFGSGLLGLIGVAKRKVRV